MKKYMINTSGLLTAFVAVAISVFLLTLGGSSPPTQGPRFAFASEAFILSQLPEAKTIEADLRSYEKQLRNRIQSKIDEFQTKTQDFQRNFETMTDLERADKQEELASMQESIVRFEREAQNSIQDRQQKQLLPVLEKVQKAIDEIAAASNYDYVLKADALLYAKQGQDISLTVLTRLGVDTSKLPPPNYASPQAPSGGGK